MGVEGQSHMASSRETLPGSLSTELLGEPSRAVRGHSGLMFVDLTTRRPDSPLH